MIYQITSDNVEMTESMKTLAISKISKLEKYFPKGAEEDLMVRAVMNKGAKEGTFHAKIAVELEGKMLYGEETGYSLEGALIGAQEALEKQLRKIKTKFERDWEKQRELKQTSSEEKETMGKGIEKQ